MEQGCWGSSRVGGGRCVSLISRGGCGISVLRKKDVIRLLSTMSCANEDGNIYKSAVLRDIIDN